MERVWLILIDGLSNSFPGGVVGGDITSGSENVTEGNGLSPLALSSVIALSPETADEFDTWCESRAPDVWPRADDRLDVCVGLFCEGGERDGAKVEEDDFEDDFEVECGDLCLLGGLRSCIVRRSSKVSLE